jgi:peptide deformylase
MHIIQAPDKWLDTKTKLFDFDKLDAPAIAKEMIDLMHREGGLGLAANQVGLDAQIFAMRPTLLEDKTAFCAINPEIIDVSSETESGPEGCLSYPGLWLDVKRPKAISAKYFDTEGRECKIDLYDLDARCFLHEYDHLQGVTFTDRVSKLKLDRAIKKQQKRLKHG